MKDFDYCLCLQNELKRMLNKYQILNGVCFLQWCVFVILKLMNGRVNMQRMTCVSQFHDERLTKKKQLRKKKAFIQGTLRTMEKCCLLARPLAYLLAGSCLALLYNPGWPALVCYCSHQAEPSLHLLVSKAIVYTCGTAMAQVLPRSGLFSQVTLGCDRQSKLNRTLSVTVRGDSCTFRAEDAQNKMWLCVGFEWDRSS